MCIPFRLAVASSAKSIMYIIMSVCHAWVLLFMLKVLSVGMDGKSEPLQENYTVPHCECNIKATPFHVLIVRQK